MSQNLLDRYARLLTTDTHACAGLFALDAEYHTRLGSQELVFRGRDDIHGFLQHVPRQISFRAARCMPEGAGWAGELSLSASDMATRAQRVRYFVEAGRIKHFEVLNGHQDRP